MFLSWRAHSLLDEKEGFVRALATWAWERAKLRACRPLLARRGYHPELVLNQRVHPVRICAHDRDMLPSGPIEWRFCGRQRPGLLDGSVGHTEIVHRGCVSLYAGAGLIWGWVMATPISPIHSVPLTGPLSVISLCFPFRSLPPCCRIVEFESLIILGRCLIVYS